MLQPDTAGRQDNLRPGDVLGALAGGACLKADDVGKSMSSPRAYMAVSQVQSNKALEWYAPDSGDT